MSTIEPSLISPVPLSPVSRKFHSSSSVSNGTLLHDRSDSAPFQSSPSFSSAPSSSPPPSFLAKQLSNLYERLPPTLSNFIKQNVGLTLVGCAQLFFVLMSLTVKYFLSTTKISSFTLIFVRMSITSLFCITSLIFFVRDKNPILGPEGIRGMLLMRGFFGFMGLLGAYQALRGLTVSDAVTIQFLAPTLTGLLGYLFLKEKMNWKEILAGFGCLLGVILVSRPTFIFGLSSNNPLPDSGAGGGGSRLDLPPPPPGEGDSEGIITPQRGVSVAWAFVNVFFTAVAYTTIRGIGDKAHALHSIGYFSYLCTICCGLYMLFNPAPLVFVESLRDFLYIILIGIFGFCAQTLLTLGLQREKAGRAGIALYTQVVFSLILEFLIWQTVPSFLSALGTAIILSSAFWATMSSTKPLPRAQATDEEALPFSRSPSPIPQSQSDRPTLRGEHYSYESVPANDVEDGFDDVSDGKRRKDNGTGESLLDVPRPSSRRNSGT
ncbi:uncharacterized protein IL334_005231 [Kwoniella shivajii]|uniref:EamA domain-containing protein n=1 Tax=Kwoniella shivajii TaxID=564305 RepID=A0ABZ1D4C9_9TREE|nr:hypothetical protein IL334_005231 [Kwoniella shivajii]